MRVFLFVTLCLSFVLIANAGTQTMSSRYLEPRELTRACGRIKRRTCKQHARSVAYNPDSAPGEWTEEDQTVFDIGLICVPICLGICVVCGCYFMCKEIYRLCGCVCFDSCKIKYVSDADKAI